MENNKVSFFKFSKLAIVLLMVVLLCNIAQLVKPVDAYAAMLFGNTVTYYNEDGDTGDIPFEQQAWLTKDDKHKDTNTYSSHGEKCWNIYLTIDASEIQSDYHTLIVNYGIDTGSFWSTTECDFYIAAYDAEGKCVAKTKHTTSDWVNDGDTSSDLDNGHTYPIEGDGDCFEATPHTWIKNGGSFRVYKVVVHS